MRVISRRRLIAATIAIIPAGAEAAATTAWDFSFPSIDGGTLAFSAFRGQVLLVTNTASFCGYTYQYEGLEKLHRDLAPAGFAVIGVPSQDFNQESDSNAKVKSFCEATFGIDFPMTAISHVRDHDAAPFYAWVRETRHWQPDWNFNKVLIGRDGLIKATYGVGAEPTSDLLLDAIGAQIRTPRPTA